MLRKLRRTFILNNMIIVFLVLAVAFSSIVFLNFGKYDEGVRSTLIHAIERQTRASGGGSLLHGGGPQEGLPDQDMQSGGVGGEPIGPEGEGAPDPMSQMRTAVYKLSGDDTLVLVSATALLSDTDLSSAAAEVSAIEDGTGRLSSASYFYARVTQGSSTYVAFMPSMQTESTKQQLVLSLLAVGAIALVVFFIISLFLSRWALHPVERAWEQQQRFIADASHELKTPLAVILANNSIIRDHPEETVASQMQWVESTQTEAQQMKELIGDLLFLAKPENEEDTRLYSDVDLSELVDLNLLQFESVVFEQGVTLDSDVEEGIVLHASEKRLQRLMGTLLDNACKYAGEGGVVNVALHSDGSEVIYRVSNTGTPIPAEDLPHIFERFYRSDKARTHGEAGGFGLGLAIAKEVATELGGTITATSNDDRTVFTATIPLTR